MTLRWVGPGLGIALLFACGKSESTPPPTEAATDGGIDGAPLKDTGVPDVFKGPLAIVDESKLGCPGDVAVDGTPVDLGTSLGFLVASDAMLVPLNDGSFRALTLKFTDVMSVHLDGAFQMISEDPLGSVKLWDPETSLEFQLVRTPKGAAFGTTFHEISGIRRVTSGFFAQDFLTEENVGFAVGAELNTERVEGGRLVGDGTTPTAWLSTRAAGILSVHRRALDAAQWQTTALTSIPLSAWQEGGKTHLHLSPDRDVVLDGEGKVESSNAVPSVAATDARCEYSTLKRTASGFVAVRTVTAPVPCLEQSTSSAPYEYWVHYPANGPGRKVGEVPRSAVSDLHGPRVLVDLWLAANNVTRYEEPSASTYTFRIQRLDAKMENLGKEVVVTLDGSYGRRHLTAVENGYVLLVGDVNANNISRLRAIRLKCI